MVQGERVARREGLIVWENQVQTSIYKGWINNQVLFYSTGNYIQHSVINHNGKEYEKRIYVCMIQQFAFKILNIINIFLCQHKGPIIFFKQHDILHHNILNSLTIFLIEFSVFLPLYYMKYCNKHPCACISVHVLIFCYMDFRSRIAEAKGMHTYLSLSNFKFPPTVVRVCFAGISAPTLGKNKHH